MTVLTHLILTSEKKEERDDAKILEKSFKLEVLGKEENYSISCAIDYQKYLRQQAYGVSYYFLWSLMKTLSNEYFGRKT